MPHELDRLLTEIRACRICERHLPFGPRPVLRVAPSARLMIIGQAPGTKVHESGVPWDDASGERLRSWLGLDPERFYDESCVSNRADGFLLPRR
jgi:uracil-DNA glycosylase